MYVCMCLHGQSLFRPLFQRTFKRLKRREIMFERFSGKG